MSGLVFILLAALALYLFFRGGNGRNKYSSRERNSIDPAEHHTDYGANVHHGEFHHSHHSHTHDHTDFSAGSSSDSVTDFGSDSSFNSGSDFSTGSDSTSVD